MHFGPHVSEACYDIHFGLRVSETYYDIHVGLHVSEATYMYAVKWRDPNADLSSFHIREQRNNISVTSLSEEERTIPNPVKTFEQAFSHYRKTVCVCRVWKIELCA